MNKKFYWKLFKKYKVNVSIGKLMSSLLQFFSQDFGFSERFIVNAITQLNEQLILNN